MKLIFVYNANSGKINALLDIAHKLVQPSTYECSLCMLTHETFSERESLKELRDNPDFDIEFVHKDEFESKYKMKLEYPIILENENEIKEIISNTEISKFKNIEELIKKLNEINT